ncbi:MAG: helix-turn-helix domain-containing protein [Muribaculaceae bacterium]|nr:helix-turn-helix domain-containing protein [Muribaculaceae bacterium]
METKDILKNLREKRQLTQEQLAERMMVTRQAVSRWETGETQSGTDTLKLLSREFDVSINTLLGAPRQLVCKCCGMLLSEDDMIGRDRDGNYYEDFCKWCYADFKWKSPVLKPNWRKNDMKIYEACPILESENFLIRLTKSEDCDDLLKVYSDKNAVPFFNSDNCDGDNFYYPTRERMAEAINFWNLSYENGWFARLSIVDKATSEVIGTIELCLRVSEDEFNQMGILRVDVRSDYEKEDVLLEIVTLTAPHMPELLGCTGILTKVPVYAIERMKAIQRAGFTKSEHLLIGKTGYGYDGYWVKE